MQSLVPIHMTNSFFIFLSALFSLIYLFFLTVSSPISYIAEMTLPQFVAFYSLLFFTLSNSEELHIMT